MADIRKIGDAYYRHRSRPQQNNDGRFQSGALHPRYVGRDELLNVLKRNSPYGSWIVIGNDVLTDDGYTSVLCRCNKSGTESWVSVDSLRSGMSKGPRGVTNTISKNSRVLGERYDALKQRCENPNAQNYSNYGGRGIENRFGSRRKFILWMEENLPHPNYRGVEIDRINNDGHYEPGNLRLVDRRENMLNSRHTKWEKYRGKQVARSHVWHLIKTDHPDFGYGQSHTTHLLARGVPVEEAIKMGISRTRKNSEEPDPGIVSRYRP